MHLGIISRDKKIYIKNTPRVPIMSVEGGDKIRVNPPGKLNNRPDWTRSTLDMIKSGSLKRVLLTDYQDVVGEDKLDNNPGDDQPGAGSEEQPASKRIRRTGPVDRSAGAARKPPPKVTFVVATSKDGGDGGQHDGQADDDRAQDRVGAGASIKSRDKTQPAPTSVLTTTATKFPGDDERHAGEAGDDRAQDRGGAGVSTNYKDKKKLAPSSAPTTTATIWFPARDIRELKRERKTANSTGGGGQSWKM